MDYSQTLEYILQMERFGIKLGLSNITKFLSHLGNPQNSFPSIHVAGTNGKGSTVAIAEAMLTAAGFRVVVFTSPHLVDFRERIKINGRLIDRKYITDFFSFSFFDIYFPNSAFSLRFSYCDLTSVGIKGTDY